MIVPTVQANELGADANNAMFVAAPLQIDAVFAVVTVGKSPMFKVTVALFVVPQPFVTVYLTFLPLSAKLTVYGTVKAA